MTFGDELQSVVMYRTVKPFRGSAKLFVYFPLIIYALSTKFLSDVEGAQPSPSQREIKEARKIVGSFLRNEGGTAWLAELAKTKSSQPLTAHDLTNAVLKATRSGGKVWRAASILSEAFESQSLEGLGPDSIMGQNDNWKDLIADIEKEDDIICLYRKNTEQTTKKAEDWKKFLKTVSPGYTVHLAIDTGVKYVICLKKIDVQETTLSEISTYRGIISTTASSVFVRKATPVESLSALYPITPERSVTIAPSLVNVSRDAEASRRRVLKKINVDETPYTNTDFKIEESGEHCDGGKLEETEDEDIDHYGTDNSFEDERTEKKSAQRIVDESSAKSEDYPVNSRTGWRRPISVPIDQANFDLKNRGWSNNPPLRAPRQFTPQSSRRDPSCSRPIILVVQGANVPLGYPPQLFSPRLPTQRNLLHVPSIPRIPTACPKISTPPFNPFATANTFPQMNLYYNIQKPNSGYSRSVYSGRHRAIFSKSPFFNYKIPPFPKMQTTKRTERPFVQATRSTFHPKRLNMKSLDFQWIQQRPNIIMPSYSVFNAFPIKVERLPVSNIRNTAMPIGRPAGIPQWQQKAPTRNILLSRASIPDQSRLTRYNFLRRLEQHKRQYLLRQLMINRINSQLAARIPIYLLPLSIPIISETLRRPVLQPLRPLVYDKPPARESPNVNRGLPIRLPLSPIQNLNPMNAQFINRLRPMQNIPQTPYTNLNSRVNYPMVNNILQTQQRQSMSKVLSPMLLRPPILNPPILTRWNGFLSTRNNGPCATISRNQLRYSSVACSNPCDRPIKLQIVIQGKVQEPLKVSVLTEPGQRVEIVGSGNPVMPYGSRADTSGSLTRANSLEAEENMESEVAEVATRINHLEEESEENDNELPVTESMLVKSEEESSDEENETMNDEEEPESNEEPEIEERLFLKMTTEPNSTVEANWTMSTITNSTLIV